MKSLFYLRYALRSLRCGGQRTFLAMVCVAFGVMSLVAMQLVASIIGSMVLGSSRVSLGGDLLAGPPGSYLTTEDIAQLEAMQEAGSIDAYTLLASRLWMLMKPDNTGHVRFVTRLAGIDPATYPLIGAYPLREPAGSTLADVLREPGSAAITRDMADSLGLHIGDGFSLADETGSVPVRLVVSGIIQSTPDQLGDRILYSHATAAQVAGRADSLTEALILLPEGSDAAAQLEASGWYVVTAQMRNNQNVYDVFDFMLKGAGILGLLVGGIGVGNTMQVLLARRTLEIATLKTLGYRQRDLVALFGLETVLVGVIGSLLGIAAAIGLSIPLLGTLEKVGSMMLNWAVDPVVLAGGILSGTLTAVMFGVYAMLRAGAVRPAVLLRNLPVKSTWQQRFQALGVYAVLAVPFWLLSSVIMGSPLWGAGVIGVALAGLVVLGLLMGGALFVMVRLPMPRLRLLTLAKNNLKRGRMRAIFALIALFAGVFAIGFGLAAMSTAQKEFDARDGSIEGYNLTILAGQAEQAQIEAQLAQEPIQNVHLRYETPIESAQAIPAEGQPPLDLDIVRLEGRPDDDTAWDLDFTGEPWGSAADGVYLPDHFQEDTRFQPGIPVIITTLQGEQQSFRLAGFYTVRGIEGFTLPPQGALVSRDRVLGLDGAQVSLTVTGEVPAVQLREVADRLGLALPQTIVVTAADMNDVINGMLRNLFVFAVAIAALALVAGAVLIANSVGLAMVERRREIGILKAVGYSSGSVLQTILLEHGLMGLLAGTSGVIGVALAITIINQVEPRASLSLELLPAIATGLVSVALALGSAAMVAWRPTRIRPLDVLRQE